jgi:N-acetylglutamate synthase-like GNAT family acetyltransferase
VEVTLRDATADDVPAIEEIVHDAYVGYVPRIGGRPMPMDEDYSEVVRELDVTVAEMDGAIVGLIALGDDSEYGFHIANVAVRPDAQGTGVGRALLEHAERRGMDSGAGSVLLWTHELMTENRELYGRIGYVAEPPEPTSEDPRVLLRKLLG